jgi:hypothetical protein
MEKIGLVSQKFIVQIYFEEHSPCVTQGMLYAVIKFNGLFNNSVNSLGYITSNGRMNQKGCGWKLSFPNLWSSQHMPRRSEKTRKNNQVGQSWT